MAARAPDASPRTLHRSLLRLGIWPCALTAVCLTAWFTQERLTLLESVFAAQGQANARQVAALADLSLYAGDTQALQAIAASAVSAQMASRVEISNHAGIFVTAGAMPPMPSPRGFASAPIVLARHVVLSDYAEAGARESSVPTLGSVRIYRDTLTHDQERRRALLRGLLPGLACLALAALLAWRLSRGVTRPLQHIAQDLRALRASQPLPPPPGQDATPRELARIAGLVRQLGDDLDTRSQLADARLREAVAQAQDCQAQIAQSARARARFLAAASHDLRQPLHGMGLFIDSLQTSATPAQRPAVQRLQQSCQLMRGLLDGLLDISRLDAGMLAPSWQRVPLDELFSQLDAIHRLPAQRAAIQLHWRAGGRIALADANLLLRLVGNLVDNAIRHSGASRILVTARPGRDPETGAARLRLEVRDNGKGIAPIHHASLFEEFYQIGNAGRDARKGFGLGLSICARIAQALGARIHLRSALGRGSTFWFDLPA